MAQSNSEPRRVKPPWWRRLIRSFRRGRAHRRSHQVVVYTKKPCPLCDEAIETLRLASKSYPMDLEVISIDGVESLTSSYGHEIPVVFINGVRRFFGKVDPVLLTRILDQD